MPHTELDAQSESETELAEKVKRRKRKLQQAFEKTAPKRRKSSRTLSLYMKAAGFFMRTRGLVIDWSDVFEKGIAWDNKTYGELSKNEYSRKYSNQLDIFSQLKDRVPTFDSDMEFFERDTDRIDELTRAMDSAAGTARSNDISSLKGPALVYTAFLEPGGQLVPPIPPNVTKKGSRGFNHIQLARLLCPMKDIAAFDADPEDYCKKLVNGTILVRSTDMPCFIWEKDTYDEEHIASGMFQSKILIMVYKHIFTSPSSALREPGSTATKASQAKANGMKSCSEYDIAYSCAQYRHAISGIQDWRQEDRLFKRDKFYDEIVQTFRESKIDDPEWYKDTMQWWNAQVFGEELDNVNDSDNEYGPSTLNMLRQQRRQQRILNPEAQENTPSADPHERLRSPPADPRERPRSDSLNQEPPNSVSQYQNIRDTAPRDWSESPPPRRINNAVSQHHSIRDTAPHDWSVSPPRRPSNAVSQHHSIRDTALRDWSESPPRLGNRPMGFLETQAESQSPSSYFHGPPSRPLPIRSPGHHSPFREEQPGLSHRRPLDFIPIQGVQNSRRVTFDPHPVDDLSRPTFSKSKPQPRRQP